MGVVVPSMSRRTAPTPFSATQSGAECTRDPCRIDRPTKRIPPKYFYDESGSQLFEAITQTPEYYLTRCEMEILRERASEIARFIPDGAAMIEFGSG